MSWREQYLQGNFAGIDFSLKKSEAQFGRSVILHEYPYRDDPEAEDLGGAPDEFVLEAVLIGDDYRDRRDQFIDKIKSAGPYILVHPYYGQLTVSVPERAKVVESPDEGGIARITFKCVQVGLKIYPDAVAATQSAVIGAADEVSAAGQDAFADTFTIAQQPSWVSDSAYSFLENMIGHVESITSAIPNLAEEQQHLTGLITTFNQDVTTLARAPENLAASIFGIVAAVVSVATNAQDALDILRSLPDFIDDEAAIIGTSINRVAQRANQDALTDLIMQAVLTQQANVVANMDFDSFDSAVALRDELCDAIDTAMSTVDDLTYNALADLRTAIINDINQRGANLAHLVKHECKTTISALLLSYRLYGSIAYADDIIARNGIKHPLFIPGGTELEVLSRVQ